MTLKEWLTAPSDDYIEVEKPKVTLVIPGLAEFVAAGPELPPWRPNTPADAAEAAKRNERLRRR